MSLELVIRSNWDGVDFALLNYGRLVEFNKENRNNKISVGDIFFARVRKILPNLNACFVDLGCDVGGFLHYHDLGAFIHNFNDFVRGASEQKKQSSLDNYKKYPKIQKDGNIQDVLKAKQHILVQVIKEPISTKGARLSTEISIAGRYMVILPFSDKISISSKIQGKQEKNRLERIVKSIKPKGFGIIIRTVAKEKKVAELDGDLQNLLKTWDKIHKNIKNASKPTKILSELNRISSFLRDIFNDDFSKIITNNQEIYDKIDDFLTLVAPEKKSILKFHDSYIPIFEKYNIERQIKTGFGKTVSLKKGIYLVIEHTEAMHVIDVNSGNNYNKNNAEKQNFLEINLIAATEIARQLRLRDIGGIIIVDFIDMPTAENRKELYEHLKNEMSSDRAKHKILPPSRFGLVQVTRQRVRKELNINTLEDNPNLTKKIESPLKLLDKIESEIANVLSDEKLKNKKMHLHIHPFLAAYLQKNFYKQQFKWFFKYKKWIRIFPRYAYQYLEYRLKTQ